MAQRKKASIKPKAASPQKEHPKYILLVEDEPTHVAVIRHTIQTADPHAVVKVAGSLEEYRSVIAKSLPEIVLIDMHLPDGKALEVLASPPEAGLFPIVVMTSSGDEKMAVKAMKAGALDYVVKTSESFKTMPHIIERAQREWKLLQERKRAEEELRESELRFRSLYENVAVGLYRTTPAGKILLANRALVKILGYSSFEQLAERNLSKVGFAQSSQRKEFLMKIEMEGEVNDFESAWIRQDGSLVIVRESARAVRDSQGKTLYYDGSVEDITERRLAESASRHAEDALRESEEKFRSIAENFHDVLFMTDTKGIITYISSAVHTVFGYKSEEMKGHFFGEYVDESELPRIVTIFEQAIRTGTPTKHLGLLAKRRGGKSFHAELETSIIEKNGKVQGTTGVIRDISERKKAEETLRASEEKYRMLFKNNPVPMWVFDADSLAFLAVNDFAIDRYGYSRKEFLSMTIKDIRPPEDVPYLKEVLNKYTGQLRNVGTARHRKKDGSIIDVEITGHEIEFEGHKAILVLAVDITERKKAEEALVSSEAKLKALFEILPIGISILDAERNISFMNSTLDSLLDISKMSLLSGDSKSRTYLRPDGTLMPIGELASVRAVKEQKAVHNIETGVVKEDGNVVWISVSAVPVEFPDWKVIVVASDITEHKHAEEALRNSEEKFRKAFMTSPDSININRLKDGLYVSINQGFTRITGYTERDILGKTSIEINIWDDLVDRKKLVEGLKKDGVVENLVARFRSKTGDIKYGMMSASVIELGGVQHILSITRDITDRKQVEEKLRESEELFRKLFENMLNGFAYCKMLFEQDRPDDFVYLNVNKAFESLTGLKNVIGKKVSEVIPGIREADPKLFEIYGRVSLTGSPEVFEMYVESLKMWFSISVYSPQKEYFVAVFDVITERKQVEKELRESERKFRELWKATVEGITILDKGIIIEVNDAMCQLFGYTREQVLGKSLLAFAPAEMHDRIRDRIASGIEGRYETPALRADGTRIILEAFAKQFNYQDKSMRMVATRDITEQRQVEDALRESEERMRAIVEGTPHLFFYTQDVDANTTYVSPTVEQITGHNTDSWMKRKDWFITDAKFNQVAKEKTRAHIRGEFTEEPVLLEVRHANGKPILLETYEYPVLHKGVVVGLQGVAHDITERRHAEEALRQMQKLEGLGTLAGGIAHDFNNILGIILAYITSIKKFKDDTKKIDLVIETIIKAVQRGTALVQQILTFARKSETEYGAINVNDVVTEIMTMVLETFPKILTYAHNFDENITLINADRSQVYQVLLNLCVNARDAMPNGGLLTINTRMVSSINLRHQHPDAVASGYVCIEVSDTGEGMIEEIKKRIFEPFFTTKGVGKGTGLGLSVVFGVVQSHKGFIDVESEPGKGTTFRMYLPALQVAEPIIEKDEEILEEIIGGTETLLVVEDEEMLLMSLRTVLVEKGYNVLSAGDGLAALNIYEERKNEIALVLTDLGLPYMTGLEVCQRIRSIKPKERMILATGFLDPDMKSEFLKAGIEHFLFKPYDFKKVLKVIREVLDEK